MPVFVLDLEVCLERWLSEALAAAVFVVALAVVPGGSGDLLVFAVTCPGPVFPRGAVVVCSGGEPVLVTAVFWETWGLDGSELLVLADVSETRSVEAGGTEPGGVTCGTAGRRV